MIIKRNLWKWTAEVFLWPSVFRMQTVILHEFIQLEFNGTLDDSWISYRRQSLYSELQVLGRGCVTLSLVTQDVDLNFFIRIRNVWLSYARESSTICGTARGYVTYSRHPHLLPRYSWPSCSSQLRWTAGWEALQPLPYALLLPVSQTVQSWNIMQSGSFQSALYAARVPRESYRGFQRSTVSVFLSNHARAHTIATCIWIL